MENSRFRSVFWTIILLVKKQKVSYWCETASKGFEFFTKVTQLVDIATLMSFQDDGYFRMRGWRCLEKSSYFYRVPVEDIGKFFMPPPPSFWNFQCPPQNLESKEYNPEFSLIVDIICTSSRCPIYSSTCFSTNIPTCCFFHLTIARWNGTVFKKRFRLALGAILSTGCCCPSFSEVGVLNTFM
jgi:hypothetical protein